MSTAQKDGIVVGLVELEGSTLASPGAQILTFKSDSAGLTVVFDPNDYEVERLTRPGQKFIVRLQPVRKEG